MATSNSVSHSISIYAKIKYTFSLFEVCLEDGTIKFQQYEYHNKKIFLSSHEWHLWSTKYCTIIYGMRSLNQLLLNGVTMGAQIKRLANVATDIRKLDRGSES